MMSFLRTLSVLLATQITGTYIVGAYFVGLTPEQSLTATKFGITGVLAGAGLGLLVRKLGLIRKEKLCR